MGLGQEDLWLHGRAVRHIDADDHDELGVRFVDPSPQHVALIGDYIQTLLGPAAA